MVLSTHRPPTSGVITHLLSECRPPIVIEDSLMRPGPIDGGDVVGTKQVRKTLENAYTEVTILAFQSPPVMIFHQKWNSL